MHWFGAAAKAMSGIVDVVSFNNRVAIVGKTTWEVKKARAAVKIEWEKSSEALESSADHNRIFKELLTSDKAEVRRKDGDTEGVFKTAAKVIEAEFQCPFLPHNAMEPMNFFADVKADKVELIGPTQNPGSHRDQVAKLLKIPVEKISMQMTRMGGGFGRRLNGDFVVEAAELSSLKPRFLLEAIPEVLDLKRAHYRVFREAFPGIEIRSVTSGFPSRELGVGIAHPAFPHEIN